ncbi:MAG: hypothetical protein MUF83_10915 [Acidimicrobiales bacterium]|jgi:hypothetical protein|nr:hypothetical protein [Acidimicrobiales bacterium]
MVEPTAPDPVRVPSGLRPVAPTTAIEESARWLGGQRWIEMRLFEVLGGWVADIPELEVKLRLAEHAHHHAWHAELLHRLLPTLPGVDAASATVPTSRGIEACVAAVGAAVDAGQTIEKLVGVYRVLLPRVITACSRRLEEASPVADGPLIRALGFVIRDDQQDWREGEGLLQGLLDSPETVRRAAEHQVRLEALLVAAGGPDPSEPVWPATPARHAG